MPYVEESEVRIMHVSKIPHRKSRKFVILLSVVLMLALGVGTLVGCACSQSGASSSASASAEPSSQDIMYTVPNVLSLTQADAEKAILASGLRLGDIKREASDTVPLGGVISQDPKPLTSAKANSKVNLVVSSGKAEKKDVKVPDLKGKTRSEAEKALADVKLIGVASNPEESTEVDPGCVFKQSVAAGTTVKEGTSIAFTVAIAPSEVAVPNVVGLSRDDAKAAIEKAGLAFDSTTIHSDSVKEGLVISQSVDANKKVKAGSTVTVKVSLGPAPAEEVTVPDVTGYNWHDAEAALQSAGLAARYTGDPSGTVTAQDVVAGTKVAKNTLVTVTLATPVEMVTVPDLMGVAAASAEQIVNNIGLVFDYSGDYSGYVVDQWPTAGEKVPIRTTVHVTAEGSQPDPPSSWTSAKSASDAAMGAGITDFNVMDKVTAGGNTYSSPSFAYAKSIVQAQYDAAASGVIVRKGGGDASQPLTDRNTKEFAANWTQNIKGLDVKCYGPAQDQATVILWSYNGMNYGATFQGYGGEEMTMSPSDVQSVVTGIQ